MWETKIKHSFKVSKTETSFEFIFQYAHIDNNSDSWIMSDISDYQTTVLIYYSICNNNSQFLIDHMYKN